MMKLFHVTTTVKEYHGRKDVTFSWFYDDVRRQQPRPYAELIENYEDRCGDYCEGYIWELFSEAEAHQLKDYLDQEHGTESTTTISEVCFPIANNVMGLGAIPVGGMQDFFMLYNGPNYSLPFKVLGYFDLRQHEVIGADARLHDIKFPS